MATRRDEWMEELDDLISRLPDLGLPEPVVDMIIEKLDLVVDEIQEQFDLRSTDWEA
jgi:hypothetical protein